MTFFARRRIVGVAVTLTGTVKSAADKATAEKTARAAAPGATIANRLTVR